MSNAVTLVGLAACDPEARYFESGAMLANLTINIKRHDSGEPIPFRLEIWGKNAQLAADYIRTGTLIGVIGTFKLNAQRKSVIRVDRLELLGKDAPKVAL